MSISPLTSLDYMAQGYWQDFLAGRAVAGGITYDARLHDCVLDESLESLQRIDRLLTYIRRGMIKSAEWNEEAALENEQFRNLMVFLAFYAGRVMATQSKSTVHWYSQFELGKRYPNLPLESDDFYHHMAAVFTATIAPQLIDAQHNSVDSYQTMPLFFALEPIGLRLFGHIDRQFVAVQGGQVASGLYQAVVALLPDNCTDSAIQTRINPEESQRTQQSKETLAFGHPRVDASDSIGDSLAELAVTISEPVVIKPTENIQSSLASMTDPTLVENDVAQIVNTPTSNETVVNAVSAESAVTANVTQSTASLISQSNSTPLESTNLDSTPLESTLSTVTLSKPLPTQKSPVTAAKLSPTPEIYSQLLVELDTIERVQTIGNEDFFEARKVLDQFEQHIAKQHKPRAEVVFSKTYQAARRKALDKLKKSADVGNTEAMLRLAMYELLNEGITEDRTTSTADGIALVKQAASLQDSRAQRLLSKLYYQGIGVPQDLSNGKYWLEQAAVNGHKEAASVVAQWQQAEALMTTTTQEQSSIKRYQLLIGVVVVIALLVIILL